MTLLMGTALWPGALPGFSGMPVALGQSARSIDFDQPGMPLGQALRRIADRAGLQVAYRTAVASGASAPALRGTMTAEEALATTLAGSGLSYGFTGPTSVTITDMGALPAVAGGGQEASRLDRIVIGGSGASVDAPYFDPAPTDYISEEQIERFGTSSPADIFRGTPGVLSGESRNSGSSVDVNIRGMQGMGRVAVTVDGAMNSVNVYQGYQGVSNRTFVDPDFLGGVDITKGSDAASNGIAGSVKMTTIEASDIVEDGKTFGVRLKGTMGTNTSTPVAGTAAGYSILNLFGRNPVVSTSTTGMDRPPALMPTQGSGSIVGAMQTENVDLLLGYAYRKRGNYHAGQNGDSAELEHLGRTPYCPNGNCWPDSFDYRDYVQNAGLANYRAGEEVLNTQLETKSVIAKGTFRFGDEHTVKLGYTRFESEAGDTLASRFATDASQAKQQAQTVGSQLDTVTSSYHYDPLDNDYVDLKANFWVTWLQLRNPRRAGTQWSPVQPEDLGLASDFRVGTDNLMWGADLANTSRVDTGLGALSLTYGLSLLHEETEPSPYTIVLEDWLKVRNGTREEAAAFVKAKWDLTDWLTVDGSLRYQHLWTKDRTEGDPTLTADDFHGQSLSVGGWSPQVGVTVRPLDGVELYARFSSALRSPSIMEALTGYSTRFNPNLQPERSNNWEIGANVVQEGLFADDDRGMFKFGYFNWNVTNYLARQWREDLVASSGFVYSALIVYNLDRAKFEGLEFSGRYEWAGFSAELSANYYLNVAFCPTSGTCQNNSLYADYATNQVPPEYMVGLTLSQKLLEDKLTVGGRVTHVGPRAISHGEETARGLTSFISAIQWDPYTLVDVFAEYQFSDTLTGSLRVDNLTDQYYVDPLSLVQQPSPGRTVYASVTAKF